MNIFKTPLSENYSSSCIRDKIELERKIKTYINHIKVAEWHYHFNRIFISPGNSFNEKYIIKFLSSMLAKPNGISGTHVPSTASSYNNHLIPKKVMGFQSPTTLNNIKVVKDGELVVNEDYVYNILDRLSPIEFSKLLDIEPTKRLDTLKNQYRMFNDILDNKSMDDLDKLNNEILTEIPYEIYIEATEHNNIPIYINLKEIVSSVIIWTGLTYGYEQDLLRFAFNSACQNTDVFPIPNSQNYIPVIHIQNLARIIHKVIHENKELLKYNNCIFAVESPTNTLNQIITIEEIQSLRQKMQYTESEIDLLENVDNNYEKEDPVLTECITELEQKLKKLYLSMDFNDGILEDKYLIPYVK
ncbi:uncharacterized protein LOC112692551 [Sipha flava]|uniref:Uncharacterized protein LOC112692551 n=1 Tax=Sipha flava TaxID=143950 RepID=A0A8B8GIH5_9HEMI|nr:uncharacterized protein LOC112692551 [Sipha flava]